MKKTADRCLLPVVLWHIPEMSRKEPCCRRSVSRKGHCVLAAVLREGLRELWGDHAAGSRKEWLHTIGCPGGRAYQYATPQQWQP